MDLKKGATRRRCPPGRVHVGAPDEDRLSQLIPDELPLSNEATRYFPLLAISRPSFVDVATLRVVARFHDHDLQP
jgi:hypothetical protein